MRQPDHQQCARGGAPLRLHRGLEGLLLGTDVGGLGTLIASLASLISFRLYLKSPGAKSLRYLGVFTLANLVGLAILIAVSLIFLL